MNTTPNAEPEKESTQQQPEETTASAPQKEPSKRKEKKEKKDQQAEKLDAMQKELDAQKDQYLRIDMTFQQLMEIMKKLGVEAFGKEGDPFDPNIHNAVMHVEDETLDENIVTDVFSKGYQLGDRVLRHAMVKVAN